MHYVFLLHGVGVNTPGWSNGIQTTLKTKAQEYAAKISQELTDVEFVELCYDQVLDRNMDAFLEGGTSLGKINDWLKSGWADRKTGKKPTDLSSFVRDYALDVCCYLWSGDTMIEVLDTIAKTMLEKNFKIDKDNK